MWLVYVCLINGALAAVSSLIESPVLSGATLSVLVRDTYPLAPRTKTLIVRGFGSCEWHTSANWTRLFHSSPLGLTGSCDSWAPPEVHPFEWWFGEESFQPEAWPEPLYGFEHPRNRLFTAPPPSQVHWETKAAEQDSFDTRLVTSFDALQECTTGAGDPVLSQHVSGDVLTYEFGVYSVKLQPLLGQLYVMCNDRHFVYNIQNKPTQGILAFDVTSNPAEAGNNVIFPATLEISGSFQLGDALLTALKETIEIMIRRILADLPIAVIVTITAVGPPNAAMHQPSNAVGGRALLQQLDVQTFSIQFTIRFASIQSQAMPDMAMITLVAYNYAASVQESLQSEWKTQTPQWPAEGDTLEVHHLQLDPPYFDSGLSEETDDKGLPWWVVFVITTTCLLGLGIAAYLLCRRHHRVTCPL